MISQRDDDRSGRFPVVTAALVAIGVAAFVFELTLPRYGMTVRGFHAKAGAVPFELAHGYDVPPRDLVPWWGTPFTSLFVYAGWLHLTVTMLYLCVFGVVVEQQLGRWRFLLLFLGGGFVSIVALVAVDAASVAPVIGASGATAGVLGAFLLIRPRVLASPPGAASAAFVAPPWILIAVWFGLQVLAGALSSWYTTAAAAVLAQAGGLLAGMVLAVLLGRRGGAAPRARV
jgi:membrane associated rhomboid family serine protease